MDQQVPVCKAVAITRKGSNGALLLAIFVIFGPGSISALDGVIHVGNQVTHTKQRGLQGCHVDLGYSHESRGLYSQMLHGESMEYMNVPQPTSARTSRTRRAGGTVAAPVGCSNTTAVCFQAHDEMRVVAHVADASKCCTLCIAAKGCAVWTWRETHVGGQCHLRSSWASSSPVASSACTTGVSNPSNPLPKPRSVTNTTQWLAVGKMASVSYTTQAPFNGLQSLTLNVHVGSLCKPGLCGAANRGFWQEGFAFQANRLYEGYVFARTLSANGTQLYASLSDYMSGEVLDTAAISIHGGGKWARYTFNLTASHDTGCETFPFGQPPLFCEPGLARRPSHACLRCGGQLVLSVRAGQSVDLDMAYLAPGDWGRFAGLPALASTVSVLLDMGVDTIRTGGTYVKTDVSESALTVIPGLPFSTFPSLASCAYPVASQPTTCYRHRG